MCIRDRSVVVPVMVPSQLSVAVGAEAIVAEHWPVASGSVATFGTGAVMSSTTMFCVCVEVFPLPSLNVQVTTDVPCVVRVNESVVVPVIVPAQLSAAVGAEAIVAEHWPVALGSVATFGTGAVMSSTTMFCVCVEVFPLPSLNVQVTTDVPCVVRVNESVVVPVIVPPQLSAAVGAEAIVAEHWPVASGSVAMFGTGAVMSSTTMFCVCVEVCPLPSLNVQVATDVPCVVRVNESVVVPVMVPSQLSVAVGAEAIVADHWPV